MKERQQNSTNYPISFLLVSSTDHVTPVTGATPTVTISKNGGSFAAPSGSVSEIGNGWYALAGNATDRNTLGGFLLHATATGADPADDRYTVVPWNPFDAMALGLTNLDAAVSSRSTYAGGAVASVTAAVTVGTNNDKTGYTVSSNNDKTGYSLSSSGTQAIWDALTSSLTTVGSIGKRLADYIDAAISSRSTYAGGAVASVTAAVTVGTNNDKTGYTLSAAGVDAIWDEVQSGHTTTGTFGKYLDAQVSTVGGGSLTYAGIADAVWDETASDHNTSGTTGNKLNSAASAGDPWNTALPGSYGSGTAGNIVGNRIDAAISTRSTLDAATVWSYATRSLSNFGTLVPDIATAVWGAATRTLSAFGFNVAVSTNNDKTGYTLTSAYDSAKNAASQSSVSAIPTNPLLTNDARLNNLDEAISSRLAASGYTAPDNTDIVAIKTVTDKLNTALELDGSVYRFTINALEMAPAGEGGGDSIILPVMQGQVYSATALQNREVVIVRGDTPRILFDLGGDYTGWTLLFGAKVALKDTEYAIDPKNGTWISSANGQGYVDLTAEETATTGKLFAEMQLSKGDERLTGIKFTLKIINDVIKE